MPSGHRFAIEHVCVSRGAVGLEIREIQLETRSRHLFRHMTLWCASEYPANNSSAPDRSRRVLVPGPSGNTLLFSDCAGHRSNAVPPDTCVEVCGYLEPAQDEWSS